MLYAFDDYTVDTQRETLGRARQPIHLEPLAFNLLVYLLLQHHRVVSRQELLDHLGPDVSMTDDALHQGITAVRSALGDRGQIPRYIQTVRRRGYRFVRAVKASPLDPAQGRVTPHRRSSQPASPPAAAAVEPGARYTRQDPLHASAPTPQRWRALVLLERVLALSGGTVQQTLARTTEHLGSTTAVLVKHLARRPILWLAPAVGVLTVCSAMFWSHALQSGVAIDVRTMPRVAQGSRDPQPPYEEPPPAARPPAAEAPAAPVTPEQDHTPLPAASPPAAVAPTAPAAPDQDQSPPPEEMYYGVVLTLHRAGFLCRQASQSPCLREVTVSDTGGVQLGGILCDHQDAAQVRRLLQ